MKDAQGNACSSIYPPLFASQPGLGDELKAFMKGLNLPTDVVIPPAAGPSKSPAKAAAAEPVKEAAAAAADPKKAASPPQDADRDTRAADKERTKKEKREERRRMAEAQKAAAEENKRKASKVEEIAQKAKDTAAAKKKAEQQPKASFMADAAKPQAKTTVKEATSQLLVTPAPQWMGISLDALEGASSSSSSAASLSHDKVVSLLAEGNAILSSENATYHSLLNSGSHSMTAALGGLTPSDAKFISSLLGDTSSISGSAGGGGTLSDRIAAHALLLGSSPWHNLRSLDALVTMAGKKSREESGRATRALADWFAGAGLGSSGRKLRYFRDQPELAATATASASRGKQQRLCLFAFEDRLKKTYFSFLQTLENQSHDPLPFVRQQAVSQTFILLREKSEQEQNLMRLLVNKLGDGEKSVASKATNNLLELLNVHPNMKAIVTREVGELIRKPTRSTARAADKETTKRHHNHAKYYGVLALNQIMLTRQDVPVANSLIQLYFELFEEALDEEAKRPDADKAEGGEDAEQQPKKKKDRWRDKKGKKGGKGNDTAATASPVAETEGKMMAAILTGVRRAFPFAQLETNVFDKHLSTLFRITHSSSFNIAVQALQLIYVVATSSTTTSTALIDRFHSSLYSSMLDNRLATTSKTAMYLNLCFKAMRVDVDEDRRAAEVKRLVQILAHMDVEFVCGALFLIGELIRAHPRLRGMITDPEDDDEEVVRDQPEDGEDDADADETTATKPLTATTPSTSYDARKRDPRFARAAPTCLWEVHPLLHHHHPTVRLLTTQLIQGKALTTTPDLTLYSLSHFLDRFVYRNAKKPSATSNAAKGASGMQPAIAAAGSGEDGVRKVKGWVGDEVNTEKFWKKKVEDVPVDSVFFHHYFTLKGKRDAKAGGKKGKKAGSDEDDDSEDDDEEMESVGSDVDVDEAEAGSVDDDDSDNDSDDSEEREIWKAMKATMPAEDGDAELMDDSDDEDDEDLAELDYTDSEEEEAGEDDEAAADQDDASSDDGEEGMFDEEEDDLLPFAEFDDGASSEEDDAAAGASAGKKRGRDEVDEDEDGSKPKSKSQQRRAERKKRKAMPTFASADDYAHLLGGDDDEDDA